MTRRRRTLGRLPEASPLGPDRPRTDNLVVAADDELLLDGAAARAGARRARRARRAERLGKTTLLETLLASASRRREVKIGHGVVPAYFSQHEAELPERGSILDVTVAETGLQRPQAQNLLGSLPVLRLGDARRNSVSVLSGGERAGLARARRSFRCEPARARRADQPPRPREPRGARGCARGVSRHGAARLPRPSRPRRGARSHRRRRGPHPSLDQGLG